MYTPFINLKIRVEDIEYLDNNKYVRAIYLINQNDSTYTNGELVCESNECGTPPPIPTCDSGYTYNDDTEECEPSRSIYDDYHFDVTNIDYVKETYGLTGDGINLGVLEWGGCFNNAYKTFDGRTITCYDFGASTPGSGYRPSGHANVVAGIAAGFHGVANEANLFSIGYDNVVATGESNGIFEEIDKFIEYETYLINLSASFNGTCSTLYDSETHYLDYVIENLNLTIVKSAGHNGSSTRVSSCPDEQYYVTSPGLASNVITVGSTNNYGTVLSSFSSYLEASADSSEKPTLVVPGEMYINGAHSEGTSYSAPVITGLIALMQEYNPTLIYHPEQTIAMLVAGSITTTISDKGSLTSFGLYEKIGAGLLDAKKVFSLDYATYWTNFYAATPKTRYVYLDRYDKIRISTVWLRNQEETTNYQSSNYKLQLYDNYGNLIVSRLTTTSTNDNILIIDYTVPSYYPDNHRFTIKITRISQSNPNEYDELAYSYIIY